MKPQVIRLILPLGMLMCFNSALSQQLFSSKMDSLAYNLKQGHEYQKSDVLKNQGFKLLAVKPESYSNFDKVYRPSLIETKKENCEMPVYYSDENYTMRIYEIDSTQNFSLKIFEPNSSE